MPGPVGVMVTIVVRKFSGKLIVDDYWGMWELKAGSWVQDVIRMMQNIELSWHDQKAKRNTRNELSVCVWNQLDIYEHSIYLLL